MDYALLRKKFGERAFSHAGPVTWNTLPDHIHTVGDPVNVRRLLKTHSLTHPGLRGNVRTPSIARWKARGRLYIRCN